METRNIEQLLERIASRLDDIYDELKWYKKGSFEEHVIDSLGRIENDLSQVDANLSNLDNSLSIDLQKMNQKFRTGLHEQTGVSLKERLPNNSREGYTREHQDTAQSRHRQRPPPPSSASLSTR